MTPDLSIEAFLAQLREKLQGDPIVLERILAETEDHLGEAVEQLQASSLPPAEAERQAIAKFGSPSEIARSYLTEPDRQEKRRFRFALTRWRTLAAAGALVLLVFLGRAVWEYKTGGRTQITENKVQKAFTATRHHKIFDRSGVERGSGTIVEVFRSDGSKASSSRGHIAVPGRQPDQLDARVIDNRAADLWAMVLPHRRLISSHPIPQKDDPEGYIWRETAPRRCAILLSALEADPEIERNNILGYEVLKHGYSSGLGFFVDAWVAPELDCYELRSTLRRVDPETGLRYVRSTIDVVTVIEGAPTRESFALPEGYKETQPSELLRISRNLLGPLGWDGPEDYFVSRDQRYHALRMTVK